MKMLRWEAKVRLTTVFEPQAHWQCHGSCPVRAAELNTTASSYKSNRTTVSAPACSAKATVVLLPPDMQERKPGSSGLPHKHVEISIRNADERSCRVTIPPRSGSGPGDDPQLSQPSR
jgi:hypothetical protein